MGHNASNLLYLVTIVTFIWALRDLSNPARARRGVWVGAAGMALAIATTFGQHGLHDYLWMVVAMVIGGAFGAVAARRVKMTAMPQMVALFNGVGGGAAALVSWAEFHREAPLSGDLQRDISISLVLSALIGSISFSGSMIAFAKLQELIGGRPITYRRPAGRERAPVRGRSSAPASRSSRAPSAAGCSRSCSPARRCSGSSSCCRSAAPTCRS